MTKILILGGSGILSLDVLNEGLRRSYDITCITRGIRDYRLPRGVNIIHGDVNKLDGVVDGLDNNYDAIFDFLSFDVKGLKYKLDYLATKCKQYFFVSSSVAYSFEDEVITENTKLGNEYWDYGSNKVKCEQFLRDNYKKYGIIFTIIRPYITYGKTRIPFGIIPVNGEYWSLANRIINDKPILLWDNGKAKCTLTNTVDFAKAYIDLVNNPKAYNEAFHITSGEVLTWNEVLQYVGKELKKKPIVFSASTDDIIKVLPEYSGVLLGDKARDRIFDNSKIVDAAPDFRNFKPFAVGIAETIKNYESNPRERTIDYEWDGRIDWAINKLAKKQGIKLDKSKLRFRSSEKVVSFKDKISYYCGRYPTLGRFCNYIRKGFSFLKKILRYLKKKCSDRIKRIVLRKPESDLNMAFHYLGNNCKLCNCDFGNDLKLISIGNNVVIEDNTKFINYRPTAEFFDGIIDNGENQKLRNLGPIDIADNVYICSNVILYPNVKTGKNCLILDGSVITTSIEENSVVMGNPARVIAKIDDWYLNIKNINLKYPWYNKNISHDEIVRQREQYFFEGKQHEY